MKKEVKIAEFFFNYNNWVIRLRVSWRNLHLLRKEVVVVLKRELASKQESLEFEKKEIRLLAIKFKLIDGKALIKYSGMIELHSLNFWIWVVTTGVAWIATCILQLSQKLVVLLEIIETRSFYYDWFLMNKKCLVRTRVAWYTAVSGWVINESLFLIPLEKTKRFMARFDTKKIGYKEPDYKF